MSYTINVRVINDTSDTLTLVEKTCWHFANGCTWTQREGSHLLCMGGSGTSGVLRFHSSIGETFYVAFGVHNYKRWCDIAVNLKDEDTCMKIHPTYYQTGAATAGVREQQLSSITKTTAKGKALKVEFYVNEGNALCANFCYA